MGPDAPLAPQDAKDVFITFILAHVPAGLGGLMIAGLLAAALSSTNSELNAMSSTLICDFYRPLAPGKSERHYLAAGRWGVAMWGVALGGFAMLCATWHARSEGMTLIDLALGVMTFAYSGLVGVFLTVLLTSRGNTRSVIAAFITGFVTVLALQNQPWLDLAFPWHMTIATALSFTVCYAGRPPGQSSSRPLKN
jgi:solute:Na+ symporter, SSS family